MNIKKAVSTSSYYKLIAVFFLILIFGYIFIGKKDDSNIKVVKVEQTETNQEREETPIIAKASTTTKTYQNDKYGFQFKYIDDIKISASIVNPPYVFSLTGSNKAFASVDEPKIEIYVQIKNTNLNGDGMLKNLINSWNINHGPNCTLAETTVSKMPAVKTTQLFYKSSPVNEVQAGSIILHTYNEKFFYTICCSQMGHTDIGVTQCKKLISSFKLL